MKRLHQTPSNLRPRIAGITVIEITVTMILLGMLMSMVVPLLGTINKQQREAERRVVAVQLIDNLLERFTAGEYDSVTQSAADELQISAADAAFFTHANLEVSVAKTGEDLPAKQITITLTWNDSDGVPVAPARLTTFVYPTGRQP